MADEDERQEQRDNDLISSIAHRTRDLRIYFREWILSEIKDLKPKMDVLIIRCNDPSLAIDLDLKNKRLKEIDAHELPEHLRFIEENCEQLKSGASDDLIQDMFQLDDGVNYLRALVRELRDIRQTVYSFWNGAE